jgi:hypothetical protein
MFYVLKTVTFVFLCFYSTVHSEPQKEKSDILNSDKDCSISNDNIETEEIDWSLNDLSQDDPKLIQILKQKYLVRPNKKPLNLTHPVSSKTLKGQYGQPMLIDEQYFR